MAQILFQIDDYWQWLKNQKMDKGKKQNKNSRVNREATAKESKERRIKR